MSMTLDKHGDDYETIIEQDLVDAEGCKSSSTAAPCSLMNEQPVPSVFRENIAPIPLPQSQPRETIVTPVTMFFMATQLLNVVVEAARANPVERVCIPHTAATDLESFCWVIMYVVYRRTIDDKDLRAGNSAAHAAIEHEFAQLFSATSMEGLAQSRRRRLQYGQACYWGELGIEKLLGHMIEQRCTEPLAGLLLAVWKALWECASSDADSDDLTEWRIKEAQEAFDAQNKERQKRGLPLLKDNPRLEKPIIVHGRLVFSIQRMLEKLNVAS
ncbi:hypothetical protein TRAPUB_3159 [Trametes pubescens]|uniref:Fungal-type protein kinase domain-containing protein n=1 Tax=Trametes pubescens TaxID=154538 RepID=A0A1M2VEE2_TRAPU|nr:hypothetical protein TRAPUB_3159 [Trametes pubescens]